MNAELLVDLAHHQAWADAAHWKVPPPMTDFVVWYAIGRP